MSKKVILIALFLVVALNLYLANNPDFYTHLQTDIVTFFYRSHYFFEHGNYSGLENNEYQPGALVFFALLSLVFNVKDDFELYKYALFVVNMILVMLIFYIYNKFVGKRSLFIYPLILVFSGPIFLFRFDLYVVLFLISSLLFWQRNKQDFSLMALAWATLIKLFPLIILPYYMFLNYHKEGLRSSLKVAGKYFVYLLISLFVYMFLFKDNLGGLISSLDFLSHQPVNTEGLWGSILSLFSLVFTGRVVSGLGNWGVYGVSPKDTIGPLWFYSLFSFVFLIIFFLILLFRNKEKNFDVRVPIAIILTFIMFSKVMQHQYTLWYLLLFPLLPLDIFAKKKDWWINLGLALFSSLLFVYVYPLHYWDVVGGLYVSGTSMYLFWITLLKNIVMVILWISIVHNVLYSRSGV